LLLLLNKNKIKFYLFYVLYWFQGLGRPEGVFVRQINVAREDGAPADETKQNLARPAPFAADRSLTEGAPPNGAPGAPDTFVKINPRIAEGLLEGI